MNRTKRIATVLVSGGVLAAGAVAVAVPVFAAGGPSGSPAAGAPWAGGGPGGGPGNGAPGNGAGSGAGSGAGNGAGLGLRDGSCLTQVASGTLTAAQKSTLAAMAQEEKLAGDLYQAFAGAYPAAVFDRIAAAEDQHLTAVRTLLDRYQIADPTAGKAAGQFSDPAVQASYARLLAQGRASQAAALAVGQQVERTDIADLQRALDGLTAPDVRQAYQNLLRASQQHLTAFTAWAG
jgi:hypothetical protein